jgi:hypothetical protein
MGKLQFSMNGFRRNLRDDMNDLRDAIERNLDQLCEDEQEELIESFVSVASSLNALNCVWIDGDDNFSDMSDEPEIKMLGEYILD